MVSTIGLQPVSMSSILIFSTKFGALVKLVKTTVCKIVTTGSSPVCTSKIKYGLVAQIVEQETENLRVSGASPFQATIYWAIAKLVRHWILIPAFPSSSLGSPTTLTNICLLTLKQFIFLRRILICQFQCMIY